MMNRKKISGMATLFFFLFLSLSPLTWAQSALDAIEAKLEAAGIPVIDYSAPEDKWGSFPPEWVVYMNEKYEGIGDIAENFDSEFNNELIGLTALENSLALAETQKTQLTQASEIQEKEGEIKLLREGILEVEAAIKKHAAGFIFEEFPELVEELYPNAEPAALQSLIDEIQIVKNELLNVEWEQSFGVVGNSNIEDTTSELPSQVDPNLLSQRKANLEKDLRLLETEYEKIDFGSDLLFNEIKAYYNYNKWGPVPNRLAAALESQFASQYECVQSVEIRNCLQEMAEIYKLNDSDAEIRAQGVEDLREALLETYGPAQVIQLSESAIELIIDSTVLISATGESQLNQVGLSIAKAVRNVAGSLAILWIIIAGVRMVFAGGDDGVISEQKTAILYGIIGLAIILLADRLIDGLYGAPGVNRSVLTPDEAFSNEIYGIVAFLKALVGVVAVLFIVLSGFRTFFAQGDEAEITKERTSILWVGAGLILIAVNEIIIENIFVIPVSQSDQISTSNVAQIVNTVGNVLQFLLGFVGIITLGILIYGAGTLIMNYGDDEMVQSAKKTITNAIVGILVILSAYAIVASLVTFS